MDWTKAFIGFKKFLIVLKVYANNPNIKADKKATKKLTIVLIIEDETSKKNLLSLTISLRLFRVWLIVGIYISLFIINASTCQII